MEWVVDEMAHPEEARWQLGEKLLALGRGDSHAACWAPLDLGDLQAALGTRPTEPPSSVRRRVRGAQWFKGIAPTAFEAVVTGCLNSNFYATDGALIMQVLEYGEQIYVRREGLNTEQLQACAAAVDSGLLHPYPN